MSFFSKSNKVSTIATILVIIFSFVLCGLGLYSASQMKTPVSIHSEEEFYEKINDDLNGYYILSDSLLFKDEIKPIGDKNNPFTGMIEGNGCVLGNLVFDYKCFGDGFVDNDTLYVGLFPFNKGIIKNIRFTNISYVNFDDCDSLNVAFGTICGKNFGKISGCDIFGSNIELTVNAKNVFFGGFVAENYSEIHYCVFPQNISLSGTAEKITIGGFSGRSFEGSVIDKSRKKGWILADSFLCDYYEIGGFSGVSSGAIFSNCCHYNSTGNAGIYITSSTEKCIQGGIVGIVETSSTNSNFSNCYSGSSLKTSAGRISYIGGIAGCIKSKTVCKNVLIGGSYRNFFGEQTMVSDLAFCDGELFIIKNSFCSEDVIFGDVNKNINTFLPIVENQKLSLKKLNWSREYWTISSGAVEFFI